MRLFLAGILLAGGLMADSDFDQVQADRFAHLALDCVHKEYPNKIAHSLNSDADVHWLLIRLARLFPQAPFAPEARRAVAQSLTRANIAQEVKYLNTDGRVTFERPYGLAWLLQLAAELREWDDPQAQEWAVTLRPLEQAVIARVSGWLPKLEHPIRTGEHNNTAFGMGLMLDYARVSANAEFGKLLESRARDYYLKDKACPLAYEPSGEDFLSPCLAEADVMRRILPGGEFADWFSAFLARVDLEPTRVADVTDGKLYHLAGLNLSRAWMLEGIVSQLPSADSRRAPLGALAGRLKLAGLASIKSEHYEGGHWLGSFAVYLVSGRGLREGNR
jgi:hypothetical protein